MKQKPTSKQDMRTPPWLVERLQEFFGCTFQLDAAATKRNAICKRHYTRRDNGLIKPWWDWTFSNHPFMQTGEWVAKAWNEAMHNRKHSILLVPTGCSQNWFHWYAREYTTFVPDCRISYDLPNGKPTKGADRDTMILAFGPQFENTYGGRWGFKLETIPLKDARDAARVRLAA